MALPVAKTLPGAAPLSLWSLREVAGRLVEISSSGASATLTVTCDLIKEAQERDEPVAWVTPAETCFYPPDVAQNGIDLSALVIVRLVNAETIARAGEKLLRSGGFGLVVLDLGAVDIPMPLQTRLVGLAHHHHTALICLTKKKPTAFSLGSLVSLRVHAEKKRAADDRFTCILRVLRDKRRGPTWHYEALYNVPAGLYRANHRSSGRAAFAVDSNSEGVTRLYATTMRDGS